MIFILDVNILLSALIKDSTTREIIAKSGQDFHFPEPSLQKISKYKDLILKKSGLSEQDFLEVLHHLLNFIKLIPTEQIITNWEKAKEIMEHIDPEDVIFIATALSHPDSIIWSDDAHFDKQNRALTMKTKQILALLNC